MVTGLLVKCVLHFVVPTYVAAAKTGRVRSKNGTGKWVEEEGPNFGGGKLFFHPSAARPFGWEAGFRISTSAAGFFPKKKNPPFLASARRFRSNFFYRFFPCFKSARMQNGFESGSAYMASENGQDPPLFANSLWAPFWWGTKLPFAAGKICLGIFILHSTQYARKKLICSTSVALWKKSLRPCEYMWSTFLFTFVLVRLTEPCMKNLP